MVANYQTIDRKLIILVRIGDVQRLRFSKVQSERESRRSGLIFERFTAIFRKKSADWVDAKFLRTLLGVRCHFLTFVFTSHARS